MKRNKMLRKAFTLIELLVVIAIIAILATVIIINVTGARTKSNEARVLNNISEANKAVALCNANGVGSVRNSVGVIRTQLPGLLQERKISVE
jgi:prepilin-type N-terminal cleavage/methylation domain-containing protein